MKAITGSLLLSIVLLLTACGGEHQDDHAHDGADAHSHDGDETHADEHGGEGESAPATEAFYADDVGADAAGSDPSAVDEADEADQAQAREEHTHGDGEPHAHDH